MPAPVLRGQRQIHQGPHRARSAQHRLGQLEQLFARAWPGGRELIAAYGRSSMTSTAVLAFVGSLGKHRRWGGVGAARTLGTAPTTPPLDRFGILHGCLKTGTTYDETTAWPPTEQDQQLAA